MYQTRTCLSRAWDSKGWTVLGTPACTWVATGIVLCPARKISEQPCCASCRSRKTHMRAVRASGSRDGSHNNRDRSPARIRWGSHVPVPLFSWLVVLKPGTGPCYCRLICRLSALHRPSPIQHLPRQASAAYPPNCRLHAIHSAVLRSPEVC